MEIVTRDIAIKRNQDTEKYIFEISNELPDSHDTAFETRGWDLQRYNNNPVVTIGHPPLNTDDTSVIVGRSRVYMDGDKLMAELEWDEGNPRAMEVKRQVDSGFLRMASVRGVAHEGKHDKTRDIFLFTRQELIDWGIVMHGSNPETSKRAIERSIERITNSDKEIISDCITDAEVKAASHILDNLKKHLQ